jgi:hypothetical protein
VGFRAQTCSGDILPSNSEASKCSSFLTRNLVPSVFLSPWPFFTVGTFQSTTKHAYKYLVYASVSADLPLSETGTWNPTRFAWVRLNRGAIQPLPIPPQLYCFPTSRITPIPPFVNFVYASFQVAKLKMPLYPDVRSEGRLQGAYIMPRPPNLNS